MKTQLTVDQIKEKLKWFHGEEFNKYPFIEPEKEISNNR
jgi:hypothetical protein